MKTIMNSHYEYYVRNGLRQFEDCGVYADSELNITKLGLLYTATRDGLDVYKYASPRYNTKQVDAIITCIETNKDWLPLIDNPKFSGKKMMSLMQCLRKDIDISRFTNLSSDIVSILCTCADVVELLDDNNKPLYSYDTMKGIQYGIIMGYDITKIDNFQSFGYTELNNLVMWLYQAYTEPSDVLYKVELTNDNLKLGAKKLSDICKINKK